MFRNLSFALVLGFVTVCPWFALSSSQGVNAGDVAGNAPPDDLRATVKSVAEDGSVVISAGKDKGLARGHVLWVLRLDPKPQYVAKVQILESKQTESVGHVLNPLSERKVKPSDQVVSQFRLGDEQKGRPEPIGALVFNEAKAANFVHTVIFYLKKDAPAGEADDLIADAHSMLAKIPTVRELRIGRPSEKSTPGFGVKDYHVGLMILFDNAEGLQTYDQHPLHKQYVEKHLKFIDKVLVYDFEHKGGKQTRTP